MAVSFVVRSFDDFKALVTAGHIKDVEDLERVIRETYPDGGLRAKRTDSYIGFNLNRFSYSDKIAADLHACRDAMNGVVGYSYGFGFDPHVKTHTAEDGTETYEVWTN